MGEMSRKIKEVTPEEKLTYYQERQKEAEKMAPFMAVIFILAVVIVIFAIIRQGGI